ncbi:MAG: phosphomannomutase/phosphoglucomutase [Polyangiaceae bacterium]|nr:phosphomannomutase/phosphoglucomutase [Polyangiaceae bacterium]
MSLPQHVFREYDIRGVADRDLEDPFAEALGRAFGRTLADELGRAPRIALCRDGRLSSPRIHDALVRGLLGAGAMVVDVGLGPTPLLYFAAHHLATDGAIQITGSHNPGEDNGFKMMRGTASFFGADILRLRDRMAKGEPASNVAPGEISEIDVSDAYIEAVRKASRLPEHPEKIRIVVDAGNGAAGPLGIRTLEALGFTVDPLYCDIDGRFPNHHPDPTVPENLRELRERVVSTGARLGIAWDGDGDRIGAVDERGEIIWGDKLMILFSRGVLREHPGATILGEVKCSQTLFEDVARHGGKPLYSKTGHSLIKTRMKAEKALLAGEMSGHIFFADRYFGYDDAIYAAVRLFEIASGCGEAGLSSLLTDVPATFATPEIRVPCDDARKFDVVSSVTEHFRATHSILDLDGARIDFGDGAWGLCRASNTQPVLVLRFEARSEPRLAEIRAEVQRVVEGAGAKVVPSHHSHAS